MNVGDAPHWPFGSATDQTHHAEPEAFATHDVVIVPIGPGPHTRTAGPWAGTEVERWESATDAPRIVAITDDDGTAWRWGEIETRCAQARIAAASTHERLRHPSVAAIDRALVAISRAERARSGVTPTLLVLADTPDAQARGLAAIYRQAPLPLAELQAIAQTTATPHALTAESARRCARAMAAHAGDEAAGRTRESAPECLRASLAQSERETPDPADPRLTALAD